MEANRSSENSENIFYWIRKNWNPQKNFSKKDDTSQYFLADLFQLLGILSRSLLAWEK